MNSKTLPRLASLGGLALSLSLGQAAQQYGIMRADTGWLTNWLQVSPTLPVYEAPSAYPGLAGSANLLHHLQYEPEQRDQGHTGTCWLWGCTAVMSMEFDIQRGGSPGLTNGFSIQFPVSYGYLLDFTLGGGGTPYTVKNFYEAMGYAVPWSNPHAAWTDGSGVNKTPPAWIVTEPRYPMSTVHVATVATYQLGASDEEPIRNIKSALDAGHPLWFNYSFGDGADWQVFFDFWGKTNEEAIIDLSFGKGHNYDMTTGGGHIVACVGYNDQDPDPAKHYWIVLNSWGTAEGLRPNGLFRMAMHTDYNAFLLSNMLEIQMFTWGFITPTFTTQVNKRLGSLELDLPRGTAADSITMTGVAFPEASAPTNVYKARLEINDRHFVADSATGTWAPQPSGFRFATKVDLQPAFTLDIDTNHGVWSMLITNATEDRYIDVHNGVYFELTYSPTPGDEDWKSLGGIRAFAYDDLTTTAKSRYANPTWLQIVSPVAGAVQPLGQLITITWNSAGLQGATLSINLEGLGQGKLQLADFVPVEAGQYQFLIPWEAGASTNCWISINVTGTDMSVAGPTFNVVPNPSPTLAVRAPAGGERWPVGVTRSVAWESHNLAGTLTLELLRGGAVADTVTNVSLAAGRCHYTLPGALAAGEDYAIRLTADAAPAATVTSPHFTVVSSALTPKKWTVLFYMDGDAFMVEPGAVAAVADVGRAGSSEAINYVAQMDRISNYETNYGNWYDTKRFYITNGLVPTPANACQHLGELNMSRPETLTDFINWATDNYPAEQYFLVMMDHGSGWHGGLITDESNGNKNMSTRELQQALEAADTPVTILGLDMCVEADVEIAYQLRNSGPQVFIASQIQETKEWPYRTVFQQLEAKLDTEPPALAAWFCDAFIAKHSKPDELAILSAILLNKLDPLKTAIASFADTMVADPANQLAIQQQADLVSAACRAAVFHSARTEGLQQQVFGLNIYFPDQPAASDYSDYGPAYVDFPTDAHWRGFLGAFLVSMTNTWIGEARQFTAPQGGQTTVDLYRFCQAISPTTNQCKVTFASIGQGATSPISNASLYATNGQTLLIRAEGWKDMMETNHFVRWVGDAHGTIADPLSDSTTLEVHGDTLVMAYFSSPKAQYTVTFLVEGNGTVNGTNSFSLEVASGGSCAPVFAQAAPGYSFAGWGRDYPENANPLVLTNVLMDTTLIGFFWPVPPSLSIRARGPNVRLDWPADALDYDLEATAHPSLGPWVPVPGVVTNTVTLPRTAPRQFYRLHNGQDGRN